MLCCLPRQKMFEEDILSGKLKIETILKKEKKIWDLKTLPLLIAHIIQCNCVLSFH